MLGRRSEVLHLSVGALLRDLGHAARVEPLEKSSTDAVRRDEAHHGPPAKGSSAPEPGFIFSDTADQLRTRRILLQLPWP